MISEQHRHELNIFFRMAGERFHELQLYRWLELRTGVAPDDQQRMDALSYALEMGAVREAKTITPTYAFPRKRPTRQRVQKTARELTGKLL